MSMAIIVIVAALALLREFCPRIINNEVDLMPYFPRLIKIDRMGFEPTTSAVAAFLAFPI
jgi:hypothetical protein